MVQRTAQKPTTPGSKKTEGRILWRHGPSRMLDRAERLGMIEGASWTEEAVGTNGIGTFLASGSVVQVFSAEHYSRSQHPWDLLRSDGSGSA